MGGVLLLAMQCTGSTDGMQIDLLFSAATEADPAPVAAVDEAGVGFTLTSAYLVVTELQLLSCAAPAASLRALLGPSIAHAHGVGSATVMAAPQVLDLLGGSREPLAWVTMAPPPGDYCGVRLAVGPADADAEGLPVSPDMRGNSLYLAGEIAPGSGRPAIPFELHTDLSRDVTIDLDGASTGGALRLSSSGDQAALRVVFAPESLFERTDLSQDTDDVLTFMAIDNLLHTVVARTVSATGQGD